MRFGKLSIILMLVFISLTACNKGPSTADQMFDHMEKAVVLEDTFKEQQQPLVDLEKQEKELYDQIIDLGMKDFDKIKSLSQDAIALVDERKKTLDVEKESIDAANEEFIKIKPMIDKLKEEDVKQKANEMYQTMMDRYDAYQNLYNAYQQSLELDKELYTMLQDKELTKEKLESQISKINDSYEKVINANSAFNDDTKKYNQLKREFYEKAGLKVEYKNAETESK